MLWQCLYNGGDATVVYADPLRTNNNQRRSRATTTIAVDPNELYILYLRVSLCVVCSDKQIRSGKLNIK